jgi:hypothetical protein
MMVMKKNKVLVVEATQKSDQSLKNLKKFLLPQIHLHLVHPHQKWQMDSLLLPLLKRRNYQCQWTSRSIFLKLFPCFFAFFSVWFSISCELRDETRARQSCDILSKLCELRDRVIEREERPIYSLQYYNMGYAYAMRYMGDTNIPYQYIYIY